MFALVCYAVSRLTHWGGVTHICGSTPTIIGSDNGLSPGWRQAIIWTNAGILSTGPVGTNFIEILMEILIFSFQKMSLKVSSAKWRFCLGLNVWTHGDLVMTWRMVNLWWQTSKKLLHESMLAFANWTAVNKLQWNFYEQKIIFSPEHVTQNIIEKNGLHFTQVSVLIST